MQVASDPYPKSRQLARGERRYRRKIASPKQWQAITAAKIGPCRCCGSVCEYDRLYGLVEYHHVVARVHGGDDVADNIVPVCHDCHDAVTRRDPVAARNLLASLDDAEYSYAVTKAGEDYFERAYGLRYAR